jgi:hypothetical protein
MLWFGFHIKLLLLPAITTPYRLGQTVAQWVLPPQPDSFSLARKQDQEGKKFI